MVKKKKKEDAISKGQCKISNFFSKAAPSRSAAAPRVVPVDPVVINLDSDDDGRCGAASNRISSGASSSQISSGAAINKISCGAASNQISSGAASNRASSGAASNLISSGGACNRDSSGDSDCISPSPVKLPSARKRKRRTSGRKRNAKRNNATPVKCLKFPEKSPVLTPERIRECFSEILGIEFPFKIDIPDTDVKSTVKFKDENVRSKEDKVVIKSKDVGVCSPKKDVGISSPDKSISVFRELNDNTSPLDQVVTAAKTKRSVSHKLFDDIVALKPAAKVRRIVNDAKSLQKDESAMAVGGVPIAATRSPPTTSRSPTAITRSPTATSRSPTAITRSPTATSRSPTATSRSPTATSRSPTATSKSPTGLSNIKTDVPNMKTDFSRKLHNTSKTDTTVWTSGLQATILSPSSRVVQSHKGSSPGKAVSTASNSTDPGLNGDEWFAGLSLEDWDMGSLDEQQRETGLDLQRLQRCTVLEVTQVAGKRDKVVLLQAAADGKRTTCVLREMWSEYCVKTGDVVSVQATRGQDRRWCVDSGGGLLVVNPDKLISGTAVVGSLFCQRRSVLASHFQGSDPPNREMVVGILVHDLLQKVLQENLRSSVDVAALAKRLIRRSQTTFMLYAAGLSLDATLTEVLSFVAPITAFVARYYRPAAPASDPAQPAASWGGEICEIQDIEENVWAPALGLKGKIDVTAAVRVRGVRSVVPLEIKTGRASRSAEHKGQVMLYDMMMRETGRDPGHGLLLYIKSGLVEEVQVKRAEQAGLVHLRNRLSEFLCAQMKPPEDGARFERLRLPDPIEHHNACAKCPYLTLCSTFLQQDGLQTVSASNPLRALIGPATGHLSTQHVDYFLHWTSLLLLEDTAVQPTNQKLADLWTLSPAERESGGGCISGLQVSGRSVSDSGRWLYTLRRPCADTIAAGRLSAGDYVSLSTTHRAAVYTGTITSLAPHTVCVATDRLIRHDADTVFHVDALDGFVSSTLNLTFLSGLMDDTERAGRLRRSIVDKAPAAFGKVPRAIVPACADVFQALNVDQQTAVLKVFSASDYVLIRGMPGCGKTATIAALVAVLVRLNMSVLVTSHTHSAVDNVLLKVRAKSPEIRVLRLGKDSRIHPDLQEQGEAALLERCATPEALEAALNGFPVVATTCLGANHALLGRRRFSVCIVDESTQALQPSVLRSLLAADKFVLVGDPDQLPPVVRHRQARTLGMTESLFARLDGLGATMVLRMQYRMNRALNDLANALTYKGRLRCADEGVASATLCLALHDTVPEWLREVLSCRMEDSAVFLDTGRVGEMSVVPDAVESDRGVGDQGSETVGDQGCKVVGDQGIETAGDQGSETVRDQGCKVVGDQGNSNVYEASVVMVLVQTLRDGGIAAADVGVIAPFRSQVSLLRRLLSHDPAVEVNTVDQYQGRDKAVIVYSCTRSGNTSHAARHATEILGDKRRLTVAVTRAKQKLIVVGDASTLRHYDPFACLLGCVGNVRPLRDGERGFGWAPLVRSVRQALSAGGSAEVLTL